jgi:cytoskeletal protein RodZ
MRRHGLWAIAFCAILCVAACSNTSQNSSSSSSSTTSSSAPASSATSAAPVHTALPDSAKTPVTFNFTDVAVATAGSNTLRLGFDIANNSKDPLLCDSSEFYAQLSDGTVLPADGSADNTCDPNSVDPNSAGKAVMYFDLPHQYTGPLIVFLVVNDAVIGQGTTTMK